jgi:uncharacterized protein YjbI with pentapeptide repeats
MPEQIAPIIPQGAQPALSTAAKATEEWRQHWQAFGQPWRTEPEIDETRQRELAERLATPPDWRRGIFPFRDMKLTRADVEWLLATAPTATAEGDAARKADGEDGEDEQDAEGEAGHASRLDLRGADLRRADLRSLPLRRLDGGLTWEQWQHATDEQREMAAVRLDRADLSGAHLEGANLRGASLVWARLSEAHLEEADLVASHLQHATLDRAHLDAAEMYQASLREASLVRAQLGGADLHGARLEGADLTGAALSGTILRNAHLEDVTLRGARLHGVRVDAEDLARVRAWRPDFPDALPPADLRGAALNTGTDLLGVVLGDPVRGYVQLADIRWGDAIATVIQWSRVTMLGDERVAREPMRADGRPKARTQRIAEYETAIRANRQLAIVLQGQGLANQALRFTYRAQVLARQVLWWQARWNEWEVGGAESPLRGWGRRIRALGGWAVSKLLDLVSGYGAKLERCFITYVLVVLAFTVTHFVVGLTIGPPLSPLSAFAMSIQSLHGRNFSFTPTSTQMGLNTVEAIVGLNVEALIVAVITRRILGLG